MNFDTLTNLISLTAFLIVAVGALIGAIFYGAWWHLLTAGICFLFVVMLWEDEHGGTESLKSYFKSKKK